MDTLGYCTMCILFLYELLKVVSHDLGVLSMSVMGLKNTHLDGDHGVSSSRFFLIIGIF